MMNTTSANLKLSGLIFSRLMSGKVINQYEFSASGERIEDALFTEIFSNLDIYVQQYAMSNLELIAGDSFYYVRDADRNSKYSEATKKIQVLLLLIGRHITFSGSVFEKMTNPKGGITEEDLLAIPANEEFNEILERSEIFDIVKGVKLNLIDRGVMQQLGNGCYVLTPAGASFFDGLFT